MNITEFISTEIDICQHPAPSPTLYILHPYLPVPYVVEMADGYPPIPCPGRVGVATETTGVAND